MDLEGHYPINKTERREDGRFSTEHPGPSRVGIFNDFEVPVDDSGIMRSLRPFWPIRLFAPFRKLIQKKRELPASWGGTLTSTIMGVDNRFKFAIPVYGCGYLPDSDSRQGMAIKPGKHTEIVNTYFDGSAYFQNVRIPTFWLNGTNDGAFAMPSNQRSAKRCEDLRLSIRIENAPSSGWEPRRFTPSRIALSAGPPLTRFDVPGLEGDRAWVAFNSGAKVIEGKVYYTKDQGIWNERNWEEAPAKLGESEMSTTLPEGVTVFYFAATDERGLMVSSEYLLVE